MKSFRYTKCWSIPSIVGILLFSFFFSIGIVLARHKPLWNDELYGQQVTVQQISWPRLISGHNGEWNSFPLYYALQKGLLGAFHYQLPFVWDRSWFVVNPQAQLVLRLLPDLLMSLGLTAIVLFFGLRGGVFSGAMAALICLSTPMVWQYWVEARSYTLWFALTVFQSLLFLDSVSKKDAKAGDVPFLLVNLGLCLSAPFGIVQTIVGQGLLWCNKTRDMRFHMITGPVPLVTGGYYFINQLKTGVSIAVSWQDLFLSNFTIEELIFLGFYGVFLMLPIYPRPSAAQSGLGRVFLPFCLSLMIITLAGILYLVHHSIPQAAPVAPRHFLYLTPVGIIMTSAIFADLWSFASKGFWWQVGSGIVFTAGLLSQLLSLYATVIKSGVYF